MSTEKSRIKNDRKASTRYRVWGGNYRREKEKFRKDGLAFRCKMIGLITFPRFAGITSSEYKKACNRCVHRFANCEAVWGKSVFFQSSLSWITIYNRKLLGDLNWDQRHCIEELRLPSSQFTKNRKAVFGLRITRKTVNVNLNTFFCIFVF